MSKHLDLSCQKILKECVGCGQCIQECPLLQNINEELPQLASRQPTVEEAFSCSLCGLCEAVCPVSLSPRAMFAAKRNQAVDAKEILIEKYKYMFPDRKLNVLNVYRDKNNIRYDDLNLNQSGSTAFFPGCTLLTYSPELTRSVFKQLNEKYADLTLLDDCCGTSLYQLGLVKQGENYVNQVNHKLVNLKVKVLITACPNCYYQLRGALKNTGITLLTVYEALQDTSVFTNTRIPEQEVHLMPTVTIHDSCPDRFDGLFATQSREALRQKGYKIVEMEHNRKESPCCGSGGQLTHFQPDMANDLVMSRVDEAQRSEAQIITAYCLSCVLNLNKFAGHLRTEHVLNLLMEVEPDFKEAKNNFKRLFEGPEGVMLWEKIMA